MVSFLEHVYSEEASGEDCLLTHPYIYNTVCLYINLLLSYYCANLARLTRI